jgi:hypothetical protein
VLVVLVLLSIAIHTYILCIGLVTLALLPNLVFFDEKDVARRCISVPKDIVTPPYPWDAS